MPSARQRRRHFVVVKAFPLSNGSVIVSLIFPALLLFHLFHANEQLTHCLTIHTTALKIRLNF